LRALGSEYLRSCFNTLIQFFGYETIETHVHHFCHIIIPLLPWCKINIALCQKHFHKGKSNVNKRFVSFISVWHFIHFVMMVKVIKSNAPQAQLHHWVNVQFQWHEKFAPRLSINLGTIKILVLIS
jgi:hypothetical protein